MTIDDDSESEDPDLMLVRHLERLLAADGAVDDRAFAAFLESQRQLGLTHGERPLCRHLRPIVISEARYQAMARASELILGALEVVALRARVDEAIADEIGLSADERALAEIDPGYPQGLAVGRLDMLVDDSGFHVLELNADSPAGITDQPMVHQVLGALPHMRAMGGGEWAPGAPVRAPRPDLALLAALREIFAAWSAGGGDTAGGASAMAQGPRPLRTIAIVDWCGVDTTGELQAVAGLLTDAGHRAVCVDPDQLSYSRGRLRADVADASGGEWGKLESMEVDLVYRRIITNELVARRGMDHPLIRAYRDRAVCVANSFRTKALNKKAAFAILTDPRHAGLFSEPQQRAIAAHVPWTRRVRPAMAKDLIARREELVLKPNDEYGGRGILLGWRTEPEQWAAAITAAGHEAGDTGAGAPAAMVVQERRHPRTVRLPTYDGAITYEEVYFDFCPFLFAGRTEGAMVRVSATPVSNVSAGGGIAGLLIAGRRSEDSSSVDLGAALEQELGGV